jgi:starch synthase (maltosyl-transferring)
MKGLQKMDGRWRVVIENIQPTVDGGLFPCKRVEGEAIEVRADVFADGHDAVRAVLRWRRDGEHTWREQPLRELGNDAFAMAWLPDSGPGLYTFSIAGWCDHFLSWHAGFLKKAEAGDPKLEVELKIGAQLVAAAAARAGKDAAAQVDGWARTLADVGIPLATRVDLVSSGEFVATLAALPDRTHATVSAEIPLLVERERAVFSTWYEFFPRSCADDGRTHATLHQAAARLPEIAAMGFDVVYLPPIHPIGKLYRKGRNNALVAAPDDVGSPWAIGSAEGGHKAIHPQLGGFADFRYFREEAERLGLEVALDIAFQCAPDHPYVREHPQWFRWRPDGSVQYAENPPKKYQDILPFDFETDDWQALWQELKSVFTFWMGHGVRIFRVDNPHTKPMAFWHWLIIELKRADPGVILLAEAFTRPRRKYRLAKCGFTQGYTYFTWRNHPHDMRAYLEELCAAPARDTFLPNFWPNTPDILHEDLQNGNRATFLGRYVLAALLSSNTGIYGPAFELMDREPFPGKEEYNNNEKYELKVWNRADPSSLRPEISRINRLRRDHPALRRTFNLTFADCDNPCLLAWLKQTPDHSDQIIVVLNMDWHWTQSGHVILPLAALGIPADRAFGVQDLLDPAEPIYSWRGARNFVRLDPGKCPAHVFRVLR